MHMTGCFAESSASALRTFSLFMKHRLLGVNVAIAFESGCCLGALDQTNAAQSTAADLHANAQISP